MSKSESYMKVDFLEMDKNQTFRLVCAAISYPSKKIHLKSKIQTKKWSFVEIFSRSCK